MLAASVNSHNKVQHPFECDTWDPAEIVASSNYSRVADDPPPYLSKAVAAKPVPIKLTEDDVEFLRFIGVKW